MNKLFVRLAASGMMAATLTAPAFASNVSMDTTGPGSTNTVTSTNGSYWSSANYNWVGLSNWNNQWSNSGNSWTGHNTWAEGTGGSGNAYNTNTTGTGIYLNNGGLGQGLMSGGSNGNGALMANIHLTGPDSYNRISYNNNQSYRSENYNQVNLTNANQQAASSGDIYATGNTVVQGAGMGSGEAANVNDTATAVQINNGSGATPAWGNTGGSLGSATIGTSGPDSYNTISSNNHQSYSSQNTNAVSMSNTNSQQASTGDVVVSHNTVANGIGGSGDASNINHTATNVSLNN